MGPQIVHFAVANLVDLCGLGRRREQRGIGINGVWRVSTKCGVRAANIEEVDVASEVTCPGPLLRGPGKRIRTPLLQYR